MSQGTVLCHTLILDTIPRLILKISAIFLIDKKENPDSQPFYFTDSFDWIFPHLSGRPFSHRYPGRMAIWQTHSRSNLAIPPRAPPANPNILY